MKNTRKTLLGFSQGLALMVLAMGSMVGGGKSLHRPDTRGDLRSLSGDVQRIGGDFRRAQRNFDRQHRRKTT